MSAAFRWRTKFKHFTPRATSLSLSSPTQSSLKPPLTHSPTLHHHHHLQRLSILGFGFQERHKWDGSSDDFDQIRAEVNCPRCSKLMRILFSTRPLSITTVSEPGVFQALNLCPKCRTAFYFRPTKLVPLQGSFIEIGRLKDDDENGNMGARIWEKLRTYGKEGEDNKREDSASGVEMPTLDGPTAEVQTSVDGGRGLGEELLTPKEICRRLDEFVIGQEGAKKVS